MALYSNSPNDFIQQFHVGVKWVLKEGDQTEFYAMYGMPAMNKNLPALPFGDDHPGIHKSILRCSHILP